MEDEITLSAFNKTFTFTRQQVGEAVRRIEELSHNKPTTEVLTQLTKEGWNMGESMALLIQWKKEHPET